jgi:phage shock protein E
MHRPTVFLAALLFTLSALADHGGPPVPGQPVVIDVRTASEYRQSHVSEAINIPFDEIAGRIVAFVPDRDARIVLYCRSGRRSGIAEQALRQLGYHQIENKGGLHNMLRDGYRTD